MLITIFLLINKNKVNKLNNQLFLGMINLLNLRQITVKSTIIISPFD